MNLSIAELKSRHAQNGTLLHIGIRPERKGDIKRVKSVDLNTEEGIVGDHYSGSSGKRHVTLIQSEHLETVAKLLEKDSINPDDLRRNLVVKGIPLLSLVDKEFKIGKEVILKGTGKCHPCSRMEENLGYGGYNAMRGHGGITARVIKGGTIQCGDRIKMCSKDTPKT